MDEESEQIVTDAGGAPISNTRIKILIPVSAVAGSLISSYLITPRFGIGFFVGGIFALVGFFWLEQSLRQIVRESLDGEAPRFVTARYFGRYAAMAGVASVAFLSGIPVASVLAGMAAVVPAVMIEAFLRIAESFFIRKGL